MQLHSNPADSSNQLAGVCKQNHFLNRSVSIVKPSVERDFTTNFKLCSNNLTTIAMSFLAKNLQKFKVVTFDCTDTLLYFRKRPEVQYLKTAADFGFPEDRFDKNLMKLNFRKQFKELHNKYPNFGQGSIAYQKWWQQLVINVFTQSSREQVDVKRLEPVALKLIHQYKTNECWEKFDKSNELITAVKNAGKVVGIISNFDPRLHDLLKDTNLPKFDFVATSYEAGCQKPNVEIFKYAQKLSNVNFDPSEALHIGNDFERDFKGARNANWSSVLVNSDVKSQQSFNNVEEFWNVITTRDIEL